MPNNILLTIVIPTYNRQNSLEKTIESLKPLCVNSSVQILVIDNHSTDSTWNWLTEKKESLGIDILQNPANFGIEGNIIQGLFNSNGEYVWLLSDHMQINVSEVIIFIDKLKSGMKFIFGYARIAQYSSVLKKTYSPFAFAELSQYSIGELIFFMGNISAFIINREFLNKCGRTIYRFSGTSYPQLGAFVHADNNTTIVELPIISSFSWVGIKRRRISYDTFRSRFIGFVRAMDQIKKLNKNLVNINKALKTRVLVRALALDAMSNLCFATVNPIRVYEYIFCLKRYPGKIRIFLGVCVLFSVFPTKIRLMLSRIFFSKMFPKQYKAANADFRLSFTSESIKE